MNPIELPMAPVSASPPEPTSEAPATARRFRVEGMDCGACAKTVEQAVAALPGVDDALVSFGNGTMAIEGNAADEDRTSRKGTSAMTSAWSRARLRIAWCIVGTAVYHVG